jgi:microcystin-dependent protein
MGLAAATLCAGSAAAQQPYLGEVRLFGMTFCPHGWTPANGQLMAINQNQALFALYGTTYGGDGHTTFALPNLQGRAPVGASPGKPVGTVYNAGQVTVLPPPPPAAAHPPSAPSLAMSWCVALQGIFPSQN